MTHCIRFVLLVLFIVGCAGLTGCGTQGAGPQSEAEVQTEEAANEAGYEEAAASGELDG